jgi:hypothetical protein
MPTDFLKLSKEAYDGASSFMDTNWRPDLDYSLRAFRSEHAAGSKYLTDEYKNRSRIFRPKTRSIIRKNEAAGAAALFANADVVNMTPGNPDDVMSVAGAAALKEVLEYRLSKTIPAFPLVMGALQDAQTTGVVCSYQYWEYEEKDGRKVKDKPCIELRPVENIRIDGAASWLDPVNTSPYLADIIPMYVCNVRRMTKKKKGKTGEPVWEKVTDKDLERATPDTMETLRQSRLGKQQDAEKENATGIQDFDTVWVIRWFMMDENGDDYTYYTLGLEKLLTKPQLVEEVYFHGKRPYVMGYAILETHKVLKSSLPMLIKPLQQETNDVRNQRLDNVKFVLHKRWFVARGRQVDVPSLVRGVPGGVTLVTDPNNDVKESNWPDVTSSAYVEEDRINADLDDVAGNFSPSTKVANNAVNDTLGGSKMAYMGAGLMTDYLLRTFIETWWEPVLRQLVLLEQYYETDEVILGVCANKARLFPKFGLSQITDDLLMQEVNVTVNVGMGASNPTERFQKAMMFFGAANQLIATAPPGANVMEQVKELGSNAGFRDAARFYSDKVDPRLLKAQQTIQQLTGLVEGKQLELQSGEKRELIKAQTNYKIAQEDRQIDAGRISGDLRIRQGENAIEAAKVQLDQFVAQMEAAGVSQEQMTRLQEARASLQEAALKIRGQELKNHGQVMKMILDQRKAESERQAA